MSLLAIDIDNQQFVSLSTQEATWWKRASKARRAAYIKKHPKSKYANAVKSGKLKIDAPVVNKDADNNKKTKKAKKATDTKAKKTKNAAKAKKPSKKKKKDKKAKRSREVRAQEQAIKQEEDRRTNQLVPIVQNEINDNFKSVTGKVKQIANNLDKNLSEGAKAQVTSFAKPFLEGEFKAKDATEKQRRGMSKMAKVLNTVTEGIIGRERYRSTTKTLGHVLLSLFLGPTNYKEIRQEIEAGKQEYRDSFESTSSIRRKVIADTQFEQSLDIFDDPVEYFDELMNQRLLALSAEPEQEEDEDAQEEQELEPVMRDTIELMIKTYTDWFKQLDINRISEKLARLEAIREMMNDGYKPDPDEVEDLLEPDKDIEIPPEVDMLESDSGATPRISFRVCPKQKRAPIADRTRFDIMYDGRSIGLVRSSKQVKGNGKQRRSWQCCLHEGYNESAFASGRREKEPYTLVNRDRIMLMNPNMMTFDEARLWVKHVLNKDML